MKIIIIILLVLSLVVLVGCNYNGGGERERDIYSRNMNLAWKSCVDKPGYKWSNDQEACEPMRRLQGTCITLRPFQDEKFAYDNLPKGYENVTDHIYEDNFTIRVECNGWIIKQQERDCIISLYEFTNIGSENLTLCWE